MRKLRWGIIGAGRIATKAIVPAIRKSGNGELVAIASRSGDKANALAAEHRVPTAHGSYEALLADENVEAVYIGLPNGLHEEWSVAASNAGKHVLCEKALTMTVASARRMAVEARRNGKMLMEAYMYRHHPQWNAVRDILRAGDIGAPVAITATFVATLGDAGDHRWTPDLGAGVLFDITCYGINVSRYLAGEEPDSVSAFADWKETNVDRTTLVSMRFPSGVVASAVGSFASHFGQGVTVHGTAGRLEIVKPFIPGFDPTKLHLFDKSGERMIEVPGADHFTEQVRHFTDCALAGKGLTFPGEDGVANTAVCESAARSAITGSAVRPASL